MHVDFNEHGEHVKVIHKQPARHLPEGLLVNKLAPYTLAALVVAGSDLPRFRSKDPRSLGQMSKLSVGVSIGTVMLATPRVGLNMGQYTWNHMLHEQGIMLPKSPAELPDVFVYLLRGKGKTRSPICFARFKAVRLLGHGWQGEPKWVSLTADKGIAAVGETTYPGSILIRLGLGRSAMAPKLMWEAQIAEALRNSRCYQLRVHLYQARNLPPADDDGSADPYVVVRCCGQKRTTATIRNTLNPMWYTTVTFDLELLPLHLAPQVVIQVWDWDRFSSNDLMATLRLPMNSHFMIPANQLTNPAALVDPEWLPLAVNSASPGTGPVPELLVSMQLIPKAGMGQRLPQPPPIAPPTRRTNLDVIALGVRDMAPFKLLPIMKPQVCVAK